MKVNSHKTTCDISIRLNTSNCTIGIIAEYAIKGFVNLELSRVRHSSAKCMVVTLICVCVCVFLSSSAFVHCCTYNVRLGECLGYSVVVNLEMIFKSVH